MYKTVTFFIVLFALATACNKEKRIISIIPSPVNVVPGDGFFILDSSIGILCTDTILQSEYAYFAERLNTEYGIKSQQITKNTGSGSPSVIRISIDENLKNTEGYSLDVAKDYINLRGADAAGVFYGIQTIFQLLPVEGSLLRLPVVTVEDYPRFPWRGLHLDVSRHFFSSDYIKRYLDLMARHKLNTCHLHLTDDQGWRVEIKNYPLLVQTGAWRVDRENQMWWERDSAMPGEKASYGGYYSQEQIKDMVAYARRLHINIVPEIEMPAHAVAALAAYPEFSCTGKKVAVKPGGYWPATHIYCAGNDKTFGFLEDVLLEVMELFPSPYIHIGGDEATKDAWTKCPKCLKRMSSEKLASVEELQSYFIRRIEKFINAHGRQLIGWDEILEGGLAPEAAVMSWRGTGGGIEAARQKHYVVMTPSSHMYLDYYQNHIGEPPAIWGYLPLDTVYSYEPVPAVLDESEAKYIMGVQGNVWTEFIASEEYVEYMAYPRACALAEVAWSPKEKRNYSDFMSRMSDHYARMDKWGIRYRQPDIEGLPNDTLQVRSGYQSLLVTPRSGWEIRYTLDGSEPSIDSRLYRKPITIKKNTSLKAILCKDGEVKGDMDYRIFLVDTAK